MTYCFGLHYGHSVLLLADTIVTTGGASDSQKTTSFGQVLSPKPGESFNECVTKLVRVNDTCVVAVAGDARRAFAAIDLLESALIGVPTMREAIRALCLSMDVTKNDAFELLIAHCTDEGPALWYWDSTKLEVEECSVEGLWAIGEPIDVIDAHLTDAAKVLRGISRDDDTICR